MTSDEFDLWADDLGRKFPAIAKWFREMDAGLVALLAEWAEALEDVSGADALVVNRRMLSGSDPGPGNFPSDWQGLPAHVRAMAEGVKARRYEAESARSEPDLSGPRHKCDQCRDRGTVFIAHPAAVAEVLKRGTLRNDFTHRVGVAFCSCSAGEVRQQSEADAIKARKWSEKTRVMSEWSFDLGLENLRRPEQIAEFVAWCKERQQAWRERKRFREFDSYNAGATF